MRKISGWGRFPKVKAEIYSKDKKQLLVEKNINIIARGLGRSYGDSSINKKIYKTEKLDKFISFDNEKGILCCESGISLDEILKVFVPKGWFLKVTSGTKYVTVGGAIASDIHGKNHSSEGSFTDHVISLNLIINGQLKKCSRKINSDLFFATCGGMGLTGIIKDVTFKLRPIKSAFINQRIIKTQNLKELLNLFEKYKNYKYKVAWIDCCTGGKFLGRSILKIGEHANYGNICPHKDSSFLIPFEMPSFLINNFTIRIFNNLYFNKQIKSKKQNCVHYDKFFYDLDSIKNWNKIYGKNGFLQYQFVLPKKNSEEGLIEILNTIINSNQKSFLAVLKFFGKSNKNILSFPIEGYSLAIDFKNTTKLKDLLNLLDKIVIKYKGKIYLCKDARMNKEMFRNTYPRWREFQSIRKKYNLNKLYNSIQSKRLGF